MTKEPPKKLEDISTEELLAEIARRQGSSFKKLRGAEEEMERQGKWVGREGFEQWLRKLETDEDTHSKPCPKCGRPVKVKAIKRPRTLYTLHGEVTYRRNYHWCTYCSYGFYPLDIEIGAPEEGNCTEGLGKRVMDFAVNEPYGEAVERFQMHYGFSLSTHFMRCLVERLPLPDFCESEGAPLLSLSTHRLTIQTDGSMVPMQDCWKEAKVGTVVCDDQHVPSAPTHRGVISQAHYVATMGDVIDFEALLRNRLPSTQQLHSVEVVWVADGAKWNWEMAERLCPQAVQILDFSHAVQHGTDCGKVVLDEDKDTLALWEHRIRDLLSRGLIDFLLQELTECLEWASSKVKKKSLQQLLTYYKNNQGRMDYYSHREAGRMIGSGIVESSHRHVIQSRMKRAGQHWGRKGAEKMVRLRAHYRTVGPTHFYDSLIQRAA
jgi:hypothetical protein